MGGWGLVTLLPGGMPGHEARCYKEMVNIPLTRGRKNGRGALFLRGRINARVCCHRVVPQRFSACAVPRHLVRYGAVSSPAEA